MADEEVPDAVLSKFACGVAGDFKWHGIAAVDRTLFCGPDDADGVLVIDADSHEVSTIAWGVAGGDEWRGIAAVDRLLFCAPCHADCVLVRWDLPLAGGGWINFLHLPA